MRTLLEAIRYIYQLDSIVDTDGEGYIYGNMYTSGTRVLVMLSNDPQLNQRVAQEFSTGARPSRWLARAAHIGLPASTGVNDKTDKTILIKTSPGAAANPMPENSDEWEYVHLNDVLAKLVLRVPSLLALAQGYHLDTLKPPLAAFVNRKVTDIVQPTLEEVTEEDAQASSASATTTLLSWVHDPAGSPFAVLFGLGGVGKTTLLEAMGSSLWEGFTRYEHSHIPAFVPLGAIPAGASYGLAAHIAEFDLFWQCPAATIDALIRCGILVVFLDAFDEHLKFANRDDAVKFLRNLRNRYGITQASGGMPRLLLTSRDYYLVTDKLFDRELGGAARRYRLRPFNRTQRREFIRLNTLGRDYFSEEKALQWADTLEQQVAGLRVGNPADSIDHLVGHSLFLLAFCEYISRSKRKAGGQENRGLPSPSDFRLQSVGLFDEVIALINDREASDKSKWDDTVYKDLKPQWHNSPFDPAVQNRFLSEMTKLMVLRDQKVPEPIRIRPHLCQVEREVSIALTATNLVPEAAPTVTDRRVREQIESLAFNRIVSFFANHPLVENNGGGFDASSLFAFRYEAYQDYFIKEYLSQRFRFLASGMVSTPYGPKLSDVVALQLDALITEMYSTKLLERATNALYFLCWDDKALEDLKIALMALFIEPAELDLEPDVFSLVMQYSLLFSRLYRELRGESATFEGLYLHPGGEAQIIIAGEDFNRMLNGITVSLCALGHFELQNVSLKDCDLLRLSVRHLGLKGDIVMEGGTLYLVPEDEEVTLDKCIYLADGDVTFTLRQVRIHRETLEALDALKQLYPERFHLVTTDITTFDDDDDDDDAAALSPGRRFVDTMMRLMRKHDRPEFGVYVRKLLGRTSVPRDRESQALEVLKEAGIIGYSGNIIIIRDPAFMYHPEKLYGRSWDQVENLWSGLIARIDEILGYDHSSQVGYQS